MYTVLCVVHWYVCCTPEYRCSHCTAQFSDDCNDLTTQASNALGKNINFLEAEKRVKERRVEEVRVRREEWKRI